MGEARTVRRVRTVLGLVVAGSAGAVWVALAPGRLGAADAGTPPPVRQTPGAGARDEIMLAPGVLRLTEMLGYASRHRQEIIAARARARAAAERPAIVSALEDPMIVPSVDHAPYMMRGRQADLSFMVEQPFPLSRIRGHRREVAQTEARRLNLDIERVTQDVLLEAARAFVMVWERREIHRVLAAQVDLARQLVDTANARYAAAVGGLPEVLRAEIEVARLEGSVRAARAQVAAAEAMFNASVGRSADAVVPVLEAPAVGVDPPEWEEVRAVTLRQRSELAAGRAEIGRAEAEILVMKAMYKPMGVVRTGPAYTMADKGGWMLAFGISLPIWRSRLNAGVREARAMADMARAEVAAMTRMVEGEAAAARNEVLAARERMLALARDALPRAHRAIEPSISAYAAGTLPLASVIDVAQALWSIQAEYVSAEAELGLAWARLHRAQGRFETGGPP